jgi:hypothetical protein
VVEAPACNQWLGDVTDSSDDLLLVHSALGSRKRKMGYNHDLLAGASVHAAVTSLLFEGRTWRQGAQAKIERTDVQATA